MHIEADISAVEGNELGYGDRGVPQAGIRGGDTLVFVTEILGVL